MSKNDKLQFRRDSKYFVIYWFTFQTFRAYGKVSGGITKKKFSGNPMIYQNQVLLYIYFKVTVYASVF